jgi:peptidoglycan/LPS O-acetylase OafA/YrhL
MGADGGAGTRHGGLNGLRGVLCIQIMIVHFIMAYVPDALTPFSPALFPPTADPHWLAPWLRLPGASLLTGGNFAVMTFFALSGYVFTLNYYAGKPDRLRVTLWGRYIRLTVAMAPIVLLSWLLSQGGFYATQDVAAATGAITFGAQMPAAEMTLANALRDMAWHVLMTGESHFNTALWTVRYEFLGALMILLLFLAMPHGVRVVPVLCFAVLAALVFGPFAIFVLVMLGGALVNAVRIPARAVPALAFFGLFMGSYLPGHAPYSWLPAPFTAPDQVFFNVPLYNMVGAVCLVAAVARGFGGRFLSARPLQWLGDLSYSAYLLHLLVLCSVSAWLFLALPRGDLALLLNLVVYIAVVLALAAPYSAIVDAAGINWARRFGTWVTRPPGEVPRRRAGVVHPAE